MELAIQKATELGVHKITPVTCERSNFRLDKKRQLRKLLHWQGIATSACEQSGRNIIPPIEALQTLADYTETKVSNQQNIFLYPDAQLSLKTLKLNSDNFSNQILSILIGPEGGLSTQEVGHLQQLHWQPVKMGPRILRTETAGPAAIAALQALWGDF